MTDINSEKLNHFSRFITLLTGEMDVKVITSDKPEKGAIVIPPLENLDDDSIDVLYGLCLREAGYISKSRKTVEMISKIGSEYELQSVMAIEAARIERFLIRKFGGGAEILEEHFTKFASNPRFNRMVMGIDPSKATLDQVFVYAMKWHMLGRPRWNWNKIFNENDWNEAVSILNGDSFNEIFAIPNRKFEDSVEIGQKAINNWFAITGRSNTSRIRKETKEEKIWRESLESVEKSLQAIADEFKERNENMRKKVENLSSSYEAKKAELAPSLNPLLEKFNSINESYKKFKNIQNEIKQVERLMKQNERAESRLEKNSSRLEKMDENLENLKTEEEISQYYDNKNIALEEKLKNFEQKTAEKIEKMNEKLASLSSKELDLMEKLNAEGLSESKKENLESKMEEVSNKMEELRSKQEEISSELEKKREEINSAIEKNSAAKEEKINKVNNRAEEISSRAENLEKEIDSLEKERQNLEKAMKELESKINSETKEIRKEMAREANEKMAREMKKMMEEMSQEGSESSAGQEGSESSAGQESSASSAGQDGSASSASQEGSESSAGQEGSASSAGQEGSESSDVKSSESDQSVVSNQGSNKLDTTGKKRFDPNDFSIEDIIDNALKISASRSELMNAIEKISAPLEKVSKELNEARKEMHRQKATEVWEMTKKLRKVEEKMESNGMPLNLTEKMVEMEGWDAANEIQAEFDNETSNKLMTSVVNGCGGGIGNRDVQFLLDEASESIRELDPNLIFADVARLSPLSGFSESGVRDGEGGGQNDKTSKSSEMTLLGKTRHSVWSRKFDRVSNATVKSAKVVSDLRRQYDKEIKEIKKTFLANFKPSYKDRFVGGKEEGMLDARNIWKLAARQGDDFFEAVYKRPNNKGAATILVDLSGSCASWASDEDDVNNNLRAMVLMLSEGLSAVNIPHEVLGYYAPMDERLSSQDIPTVYNRKSCRLETLVIKGFKDRDLNGLASLEIQQAENSDGESVRIATERLLKQQGSTKMLFVISDGKPYMQDADVSILDDDLRLAYMEALNKKVTVTNLGLSENHAVMGDSYLSLENVKALPEVIKKALNKK